MDGSEMGLRGSDSRWRAASRWTLLRQGLRVVLCVLGVIWTAVTVAWLRLGHPLNALVTALIVAAGLLWVVRTGHAGSTPAADDAWSRRAVPVGGVVAVFSLVALSPSRSSSPSGAVVALSLVLWTCVVLAVWLTGTPASAAAGHRHLFGRRGPGRA